MKLQVPSSGIFPQHCVALTWQIFFFLLQVQKRLNKSCSSFYEKLSSLYVRFQEKKRADKERSKEGFSFIILAGWLSYFRPSLI